MQRFADFRQLSMLGLMAALAIAGAATVSGGEASASGAAQRVQYADGPVPRQDVSVINDRNRDQLAEAAELVDFNKDDYAGTVVDARGKVIVVAATPRGMSLAEAAFMEDPGVEVASGQLSLNAATQLGLDLYRGLPSVSPKIYKWSIDPVASSLRVGIFKALTEDERTLVEQFAEKTDSLIEVYLDESAQPAELGDARLEDDSPYAGGFRYTMQTGSGSGATGTGFCSGGFGYQSGGTNYMLTAGHCFDRGTTHDYMWNTQSGTCCVKKVYAGHRSNTTWNNGDGTVTAGTDNGYHGDLALVNVDTANRQSGDQIWWDGVTSPNKIPVTVRRVHGRRPDLHQRRDIRGRLWPDGLRHQHQLDLRERRRRGQW